MASSTLFISCDYLKRNSSISNNVDDSLLKPLIALSQDRYVEPILGSVLMAKIVSDIQANAYTASTVYRTLLETYVQPMIVQYVLVEGVYNIHNQIDNKGILNKHSEMSEKAEASAINRMSDQALQNGNFYGERLIKYLRANYTLFPELNPTNTDLSTIFPAVQAYFSGINISPIGDPSLLRRNWDRDNNNNNYSY